jgi:hypothetical protein
MNGKTANVIRINIYGFPSPVYHDIRAGKHTISLHILPFCHIMKGKDQSIDQRRRDGWQNRENSVKRSFI